MKNTHFAPVFHDLRGRGGRHSEKICNFFAKMKKQITSNVITFGSDLTYKKIYEIVEYFKGRNYYNLHIPMVSKFIF